MDKKIVLVDMDDTIEDLGSAWVERLNIKHSDILPRKVQLNDLREWDMRKAFPELSLQEIFEPLESDDFWCTVKPFGDALKYLPMIYDTHKVYICTSSGYKTIKNKASDVLFKHFPYIKWDDVIVTSKKQLIKADYLIDDNPNNLIGGQYKGILFSRPHNATFDADKHNIVRVNCWKEIYDILS